MSFKSLANLVALGIGSVSAAPRPAGAPKDGLYIGPAPNHVTLHSPELFEGNASDFHAEGAAAYRLVEQYDASNWFSKFTVENIPDPTHGYVNYLSYNDARNTGIYRTQNNQVYMGVDTTSVLDPNGRGRNSVRIHSNSVYTHGLFIADFAHIPGSQCGSWPAYWMFGPNWPNSGEIDIIEGVHEQQYNQATLHSAPGCYAGVGSGGEKGNRVGNADCGAGGGYTGCGSSTWQPNTYGTPFNANGGGVYAMYWGSSGIQVWYWASRDVPGDIRSNSPNPAGWGQPQANFQGGCNYDQYFKQMQIIFDITFCGDWAGAVWGQTQCARIDGWCNSYVAKQPQSFKESYWLINSLKVYG